MMQTCRGAPKSTAVSGSARKPMLEHCDVAKATLPDTATDLGMECVMCVQPPCWGTDQSEICAHAPREHCLAGAQINMADVMMTCAMV